MEKARKKTIEDYFEVEETQLEAALDKFLADEKERPKTSKMNIASMAGIAILLVSFVYLMELIFSSGTPTTSGILQTMTIAGAVLIFVAGMGAFTRTRKAKRKRKHNNRWNTISAADHPIDSYGLRQRKRLYRSRRDKKLFGVCGGIAEYFDIDPTIVRIIFVLLALSYGSSIIVYVILAVALPKETLLDDF